jgi:hypothetical protein
LSEVEVFVQGVEEKKEEFVGVVLFVLAKAGRELADETLCMEATVSRCKARRGE